MKIDDKIVEIPTKQLVKSPLNPRSIFCGIEELTDTILDRGLIEPLIVRKIDTQYQVLVGERRRIAGTEANLETLPCRIAQVNDDEALKLIGIEDFQKEELQPYERAILYQQLKEKGLTSKEIAAMIGSTDSYVRVTLMLLNLDKEVGLSVRHLTGEFESEKNTLTYSKAIDISSLPKEIQKFLANKVKEDGLTLSQLRKKVKTFKSILSNTPLKRVVANMEEVFAIKNSKDTLAMSKEESNNHSCEAYGSKVRIVENGTVYIDAATEVYIEKATRVYVRGERNKWLPVA